MSTSTVPVSAAGATATKAPPRGLWARLIRRRGAAAAIVILAALVVAAALGPLLVSDPNAFSGAARLKPPSGEHWFGTDNYGRDVFARVVVGARSSLAVGVISGLGATILGTVIAVLASTYRWFDLVVMRVVDGVMSFPVLVLALAMVAILGPGLITVNICLVIVLFPGVTRVVRSTSLVVAELPMMDAARAAGAGRGRILWRYVLPACLTPILVQGAIAFTVAILVESALSFIGAGLPPDVPSWGASLAASRSYLSTAWWMWVFPGAALIGTVLATNVLIDDIRDLLDPRMTER
ncbi:ABC transporter permease [Microbacterium panaciterrae]|uniref:ABC transporter permease n=1 Tax=Microbacterium panaciterrae TaxID=985759 RepID=A0ABP8PUT4_9MICO